MVERGYEEYWLLRDMGPRSVTYGDPRCVLATEDPCDRKGGFSRTPRNRKIASTREQTWGRYQRSMIGTVDIDHENVNLSTRFDNLSPANLELSVSFGDVFSRDQCNKATTMRN